MDATICSIRSKRKNISKTSKYNGVRLNYRKKKWRSEINIQDNRINIGTHEREIDAALAYDMWCLHSLPDDIVIHVTFNILGSRLSLDDINNWRKFKTISLR